VISKISSLLAAIGTGSPCTLTEIAGRSALPLSTAHRLCSELVAWRVLERADDGRFRAGAVLQALTETRGTPASTSGSRLRGYAAPVMEDLHRATGLTVRVGFLNGYDVGYIEKRAVHLPVSEISPAARLPAHATALGKVERIGHVNQR